MPAGTTKKWEEWTGLDWRMSFQESVSDPERLLHQILPLLHRGLDPGIEVAGKHTILHNQARKPGRIHERCNPALEQPGIRLVLGDDERDVLSRRHLRGQIHADIREHPVEPELG